MAKFDILGKLMPKLADVGQLLDGTSVGQDQVQYSENAEIGRSCAKIAQTLSMFTDCWLNLAILGEALAKIDLLSSNLGGRSAPGATVRLLLGAVCQTRPDFGDYYRAICLPYHR